MWDMKIHNCKLKLYVLVLEIIEGSQLDLGVELLRS